MKSSTEIANILAYKAPVKKSAFTFKLFDCKGFFYLVGIITITMVTSFVCWNIYNFIKNNSAYGAVQITENLSDWGKPSKFKTDNKIDTWKDHGYWFAISSLAPKKIMKASTEQEAIDKIVAHIKK